MRPQEFLNSKNKERKPKGLLYIHVQARNSNSGLSVYDKKILETLRSCGLDIADVVLQESSRLAGVLGALRLVPPPVARYVGRNNKRLVKDAIEQGQYECFILSHEATMFLIKTGLIPSTRTVIIYHNILAPAYRRRKGILGICYSYLYMLHERRIASSRATIGTISRYDKKMLENKYGRENSILLPPGVPSNAKLISLTANLVTEIVILGNYDWRLKREDLHKFFGEFRASALSKQVDLLLSKEAAKYAPNGMEYRVWEKQDERLRIGLVVDRFHAGFKLKSLEYVAEHMIVTSFCDLSEEFVGIKHADLFVRRIEGIADILGIFEELKETRGLLDKYWEFQRQVFREFSWMQTSQRIIDTFGAAGISRRTGEGKKVQTP